MLHIDVPTLAEVKMLALARDAASVSIYVPTSPIPTDAKANRTAFEDLAKEALRQVGQLDIAKKRIRELQAQLALLADLAFPGTEDSKSRHHDVGSLADDIWCTGAPGVALLATPEKMHAYRLPFAPKTQVEVADRFHLTPLIRVVTSPLDILVLALSEKHVRLVHAFVNLPPRRLRVPALPTNLSEATRRTDNASYPHALWGKEEKKLMRNKFARKVNEALRAALSGRITPLVLAADEPMASIFRAVNSYPHLVDEVISGDQLETTDAQLADAALPILDRLYQKEIKAVLARYAELFPRLATADVSYAAHAATAGAVETLVVDLDAAIPGFVSEFDGSVTYAACDTPKAYSVVDEVARRAFLADSRVLGARSAELPGEPPLIAILRYPFGVTREPSAGAHSS